VFCSLFMPSCYKQDKLGLGKGEARHRLKLGDSQAYDRSSAAVVA
jgi:hypothetical protein